MQFMKVIIFFLTCFVTSWASEPYSMMAITTEANIMKARNVQQERKPLVRRQRRRLVTSDHREGSADVSAGTESKQIFMQRYPDGAVVPPFIRDFRNRGSASRQHNQSYPWAPAPVSEECDSGIEGDADVKDCHADCEQSDDFVFTCQKCACRLCGLCTMNPQPTPAPSCDPLDGSDINVEQCWRWCGTGSQDCKRCKCKGCAFCVAQVGEAAGSTLWSSLAVIDGGKPTSDDARDFLRIQGT